MLTINHCFKHSHRHQRQYQRQIHQNHVRHSPHARCVLTWGCIRRDRVVSAPPSAKRRRWPAPTLSTLSYTLIVLLLHLYVLCHFMFYLLCSYLFFFFVKKKNLFVFFCFFAKTPMPTPTPNPTPEPTPQPTPQPTTTTTLAPTVILKQILNSTSIIFDC